jgi:hypothetical protein
MIAEISACIAAVQGVNSAIQAIKEAGNNASDISAVVGRWAEATEKFQDAQQKGAGIMSYKEALQLESVDRQLKNFDRQLHDICLMQGQGDLYFSIKKRIDESRLAHEKKVAELKRKRKQRRETIRDLGMLGAWGSFGMAVITAVVWVWAKFK